jgi:site-specific recombinase XerD
MVGTSQAQGSPLAPYAAGFREQLELLGYSVRATSQHLELLGDMSTWLVDESLAPAELTGNETERFLGARRARGLHLVTARGAGPLLEYLIGLGVVPPASRPAPSGPVEELLERYREYLVSQRGLTQGEVSRHGAVASLFVRSAVSTSDRGWAAVTAGDVTRFVVRECSCRSRASVCKLVSELRSFLRFAQLDGCTALALSRAVPPVATWSASSLPRWAPAGDVAALLSSCDRQSAAGRRDFAILALLVRLGLRAGEVAAMQLGDVDWRSGEVLVHGKARREEKLPLPQDVGEALADYLQHGRPRVASRSVFLRLRAPQRGLASQGVTCVVGRAPRRAGLAPIGAHRLRHTAATEMLRAGASLTEVGQALRQRAAATTAIYAHRTLGNCSRRGQNPWSPGQGPDRVAPAACWSTGREQLTCKLSPSGA